MSAESVNLLDALTKGRELPEGCDRWAIRTVRPDGASSNGFVWPLTPGWVEAPGPIIEYNKSPCPSVPGDGICVAYTWNGMASGGVSARTLLLCAVNSADILSSRGVNKLRARRAHVVEVIDGERLIREHGRGADLRGANLRGANLLGADLRGADLQGTYLSHTNLQGADLSYTNLCYSDLRYADLSYTNLRYTDLHGTNLHHADLQGADLGDWERDPETGYARRKECGKW